MAKQAALHFGQRQDSHHFAMTTRVKKMRAVTEDILHQPLPGSLMEKRGVGALEYKGVPRGVVALGQMVNR